MTTSPAATLVITAIYQDVERLRAMPALVRQALQMLEDPNVGIPRLGEVLAADQVVAAQILRYANSAACGGLTACATIAEGIVRIGTRQLKSLLFGVAAIGPLRARLAGYQFNDGELYRHSAAVAGVARRLAAIIHYRDPEEAYAAGLLHDIGKLVLDRHVRPHYEQFVAEVTQFARSPVAIEERYLGVDHATVGGLIAERWHYPAALGDAIRHHHAPTLARHEPRLAALVHLADVIVLQSGVGLTPLGVPPFNEQVLDILHLPETDLGRIVYEMRPYIAEADQHFKSRYTGSLPAAGSGLLRRTSS
ncbi:MAG: HDOD domain-containing protein [Chloroflexi bacterium]|nr:HDOD domain-containing protein [Chloroflexota bacterium]